MRSFKNRENVLTRMLSPVVTGFDSGLRIIVRLYPMPSHSIASKALCIKGLLVIEPLSESHKEKSLSIKGMCRDMDKYPLLSICYMVIGLNKMLKLPRVLTCKLPAREVFTGFKNRRLRRTKVV